MLKLAKNKAEEPAETKDAGIAEVAEAAEDVATMHQEGIDVLLALEAREIEVKEDLFQEAIVAEMTNRTLAAPTLAQDAQMLLYLDLDVLDASYYC